MLGEERVHALEIRARRVYDGAGAARRGSSRRARRDQRSSHDEAQGSWSHVRILAGPGSSREIRSMLAQIGRRALAGAAVGAGVMTLRVFLVHLVAGGPMERRLGPSATPARCAAAPP